MPHSRCDLSINVLKVYFSLSFVAIEYIGVAEIISKDTTERVYIADVAFPLSAHTHTMLNVLCAWYIYNNLILYVPLAHTK